MRARLAAALLLTAPLGGCVVTVPLRTAEAPSDLFYERPVGHAVVERLDSLGRVLSAESASGFRFTGDGAWWRRSDGSVARVPRSQVHSVEVVQLRGGRAFPSFLIAAALVGAGSAAGFFHAAERDCDRHTASSYNDATSTCGLAVFGAMLYSPILGLASGFVAARLRPDRRGPVRYIVTPERRR